MAAVALGKGNAHAVGQRGIATEAERKLGSVALGGVEADLAGNLGAVGNGAGCAARGWGGGHTRPQGAVHLAWDVFLRGIARQFCSEPRPQLQLLWLTSVFFTLVCVELCVPRG